MGGATHDALLAIGPVKTGGRTERCSLHSPSSATIMHMAADEVPRVPKPLSSLRPEYVEQEHKGYVSHLKAALDDLSSTAPLNIALTGSYGSGKSSILSEVQRSYGNKVVVGVSLSTVSAIEGSVDEDTAEQDTSNAIQKEIVKQLLYREKPANLASSRFRRIEPFRWWRAALVAAAAAGIAIALAFLTNAAERVEALIGPDRGGRFLLYLVAFLLLASTGLLLQRGFHNRLRVSGITAGPATIVAGENDKIQETYFDKYLDEIVYFFAATECSIVIFEDLDRFNEIEIYEELRELNTILNNSKQVGRPVRFLYAMRDSLFEEIGYTEEDDDQTPGVLKVASARAKFFDLVVPVVPFATRRTSLDLWYREMKKARAEVSMGVLSIAAKHVHDMRMIKNVRNEFDVFLAEIQRNDLDGLRLRPDSLFALMVYKAVHLEDFESIRFGESHLDNVERLRRTVIADSVRTLDQKVRAIETGAQRRAELEALAASLGERLQEGVERSFRVARRAVGSYEYHIDGTVFPSTGTRAVDFWRAVAANAGELQLVGPTTTALSAADVDGLVDANVETLDWDVDMNPGQTEEARSTEQAREALLHAEISTLLATSNLELGNHKSMQAAVKDEAKSELACEFLAGGFIDRNFSLYVSRFYGEVVTANAMNFVIHVVQPGIMDVNASLGDLRDVEGVIAEAGTAWLSSRSSLNTNLVDLLIDDARIDHVVSRIARADLDAEDFLQSYVARGAHPAKLLTLLGPLWPGVVEFALRAAQEQPDGGADLVDGAMRGASLGVDYEPIVGLGEFVRANARELDALIATQEKETSDAILDLLARAGTRIEDLSIVAEPLARGIVARGLFDLTSENLKVALGETDHWSIDEIRGVSNALFSRVLSEPELYLSVLPGAVPTISERGSLEAMVRAIDPLVSPVQTAEIVDRADARLVATSLANIPSRTWSELLRIGRVETSARNWFDYQYEFEIDDVLSRQLSLHPQFVGVDELSDEERRLFAIAIVGDERIAPMKRARLVASLELDEPLDVSTLPKLEGPTFAYLLSKGALMDSVETFNFLTGLSWPTRLAYIRAAKSFADYAATAKYKTAELVNLFYESKVSDTTKLAILRSAADLGTQLTTGVATAMALWAVRRRPKISIVHISSLVAAGASGPSIVELLAAYRLTDADLLSTLRAMRPPYRYLADRGRRRPVVSNKPEMIKLLSRLQEMGVVSSWGPHKSDLRVHLHH